MNRADVRTLGQVSVTSGVSYGMSSLRNRTCVSKTVTLGNEAASYGYNPSWLPPAGSISPNTTINGATINGLWVNGDTTTFRLSGSFSQNFIFALMYRQPGVPVSGSLPVRIFRASDATLVVGGGNTSWIWGSGASGTGWSGATGQSAAVQIVY